MSTALAQLSACVTRILALTGFPKELKTRDIQAAFSEWETANGGFKIKWIDDTSLLVVFGDATVGESCFLLLKYLAVFLPCTLSIAHGCHALPFLYPLYTSY